MIVSTEKAERRRVTNAKWYAKNQEARRASNREWYANNKDKVRAYQALHSERRRKTSSDWNASNLDKVRANGRARSLRKYGITSDDFDNMVAQQNDCCAICQRREPGGHVDMWRIDHSHATGKVRGLLCNSCNLTLGHVDDSIPTLERMIAYLKQHETKH